MTPKQKFEQEFEELAPTRKVFWKQLKLAFENWLEQDDKAPRSLGKLIDDGRFPADLPLPNGESLLRWCEEIPGSWRGASGELWLFAALVYPWQEHPSEPLSESLLLDRVSYKSFHTARRRLSRFWDKWGREIFVEESLPDGMVSTYVRKNARQIMTLTYLELAIVRRTLDGGPGKRWLFSLGLLLPEERRQPILRSEPEVRTFETSHWGR